MFKKFLIALFLLSSAVCNAADTYDATTSKLLIPQVLVNDTLYKNVVVTLGSVISVGTLPLPDSYDTYNATLNQLTIPVVNVGSTTYYNVVISLGKVLSIGSSCSISSTCKKVGKPEVKGVLPGDGRISVMFNFMGGKIANQLSNSKFVPTSTYTAVCTSSNGGSAGSSRTDCG